MACGLEIVISRLAKLLLAARMTALSINGVSPFGMCSLTLLAESLECAEMNMISWQFLLYLAYTKMYSQEDDLHNEEVQGK